MFHICNGDPLGERQQRKAVAVETFGGKDKEEMENVLLLLTRQLSSGVQAEFRSAALETQPQLLRNRAIRNGDAGGWWWWWGWRGAEGRDTTRPEQPNTRVSTPFQPCTRPPPPQLAARELTSAAAPAPPPTPITRRAV